MGVAIAIELGVTVWLWITGYWLSLIIHHFRNDDDKRCHTDSDTHSKVLRVKLNIMLIVLASIYYCYCIWCFETDVA